VRSDCIVYRFHCFGFLQCRAMLCIIAAYVVMRWLPVRSSLSVRLSRSRILSKRIKVSSIHFRVVTPFIFFGQNLMAIFRRDPPIGGVEWRWSRQKWRFFTTIWLWHRWLLDRRVSSTFRRRSYVIALSGGVCWSRETDDEAPRICKYYLWQPDSMLRRTQQNII